MSSGIKNIVITGPESTGKSTLAMDLAKHFNTVYIPEFARSYIEGIKRPYEFSDLEIIAKKQIEEAEEYKTKANSFLFFDTYLIITKVWFDVVYKRCPNWVIEHLNQQTIDLFLVCNTDIPWIPDSVRENGGEMREKLLKMYISEIGKFNFKYKLISGTGEQRLKFAIQTIESCFKL